MTTVDFPKVAENVRGNTEAQLLVSKVCAGQLAQTAFESALHRAFSHESTEYQAGFARVLEKLIERTPSR